MGRLESFSALTDLFVGNVGMRQRGEPANDAPTPSGGMERCGCAAGGEKDPIEVARQGNGAVLQLR